jgi:hypothetical protein
MMSLDPRQRVVCLEVALEYLRVLPLPLLRHLPLPMHPMPEPFNWLLFYPNLLVKTPT